MAKEYIEREEALRIVRGFCHPANIGVEIAKLPAADVRPVVHGRWEFEYETLDDVEYCCTVCDWIGTNANEYNYCPNCGADMREG